MVRRLFLIIVQVLSSTRTSVRFEPFDCRLRQPKGSKRTAQEAVHLIHKQKGRRHTLPYKAESMAAALVVKEP
jgi:outer membrane biogenesis lipoprotein LolB